MSACLLVTVLRDPSHINKLTLFDWDLIVRQARRAGVLAILAFRLQERNLLSLVPERPRLHFKTQQLVAGRHAEAIEWEVSCIEKALSSVGISVVLLKGAAYSLANLPSSKGRLYSDVDILVAKIHIEEAESALIKFGWEMEKLDSYDQKYYRLWMHEIPPMTHKKRGASIDVHHNILPETVKSPLDASELLQGIQRIDGNSNIYTLSPYDLVLHSMAHLFHEGEFDHGLRDLLDLDALLIYFNEKEEDFWGRLLMRSRQLDLQLSLYYGLRYVVLILGTEVPSFALREASSTSFRFPKLMDFLFMRALLPNHVSCDDRWTGLARWVLYFRSHYLRMPLRLLIPHLLRKAYKDRVGDKLNDTGDIQR